MQLVLLMPAQRASEPHLLFVPRLTLLGLAAQRGSALPAGRDWQQAGFEPLLAAQQACAVLLLADQRWLWQVLPALVLCG